MRRNAKDLTGSISFSLPAEFRADWIWLTFSLVSLFGDTINPQSLEEC